MTTDVQDSKKQSELNVSDTSGSLLSLLCEQLSNGEVADMASNIEEKLAEHRDVASSVLDNIFADLRKDCSEIIAEQIKCDAYSRKVARYCDNKENDQTRSFVLKLNVGGRNFDVSESSIPRSEPEHNILSILLSFEPAHHFIRDERGRIFLNVNPDWFEAIINPLRRRHAVNYSKQPIPKINPEHRTGFHATILYYNLFAAFIDSDLHLSSVSNIEYMNNHDSMALLYQLLTPEFATCSQSPKIGLNLLYRGTRDGFEPTNFMDKCGGGQCETVCIVEDTKGNVFGGFAKTEWENNTTSSGECFLFTIENVRGPAVKVDLKTYYKNNVDAGVEGPVTLSFGQHLRINELAGTSCPANAPLKKKSRLCSGELYLSGADADFTVREIEVYSMSCAYPDAKPISLSWGGMYGSLLSSIRDALGHSEIRTNLVYHSTRDGFDCGKCHALYDNKPMTLFIIKDDSGETFACFCDFAWRRDMTQITSKSGFICTLGGTLPSQEMKQMESVKFNPHVLCSFGDLLSVLTDRSILQRIVPQGTEHSPHPIRIAIEIAVFEVTVCESVKEPEERTLIARSLLEHKLQSGTNAMLEEIKELTHDLKGKQAKLLTELLWIEHLSRPPKSRDIEIGLLREWLAVSEGVRALGATSCRMAIMAEIEAAMTRVEMLVSARSAENDVSTVKGEVEVEQDEVVSYNVGGTIIAVLKSTLLRQAPDSTFAARFSGRWEKENAQDNAESDGAINLVRSHSAPSLLCSDCNSDYLPRLVFMQRLLTYTQHH